ncbi:MAG: hypothetical protein QXO22_08115 [Thermosphaera sp.]
MPKTETFINPLNKYYLGVTKTSQTPSQTASAGLEVKPRHVKTPTQTRLAYEDYLNIADIIVNDILASTKEINISEIARMFGLSDRQLSRLISIMHENWRVYVKDNNKLVLEV